MTTLERISRVKALVGHDAEATDEVVTMYLSDAESAILNELYPFGNASASIPPKYHGLQCKLASRYFYRRGGEGEIEHAENGVTRRYGSVDDRDLLNTIVPYCEAR